jgi:hypothetical protein
LLRRFLLSLAALALAWPAHAAINQWIAPGDGAWDDPTVWSLGHAPVATDEVLIAPQQGVTVTGPAAPTAVAALVMQAQTSGTTTLALAPDGDVDVAGDLIVLGRASLRVNGATASGGNVFVIGAAAIDSSAGAAELHADGQLVNMGAISFPSAGGAQITGGRLLNGGTIVGGASTNEIWNAGTIRSTSQGASHDGPIVNLGRLIADDGSFPQVLLNAPSGVISGTGSVGNRAGVFMNRGRIELAEGAIRSLTTVNEGVIETDNPNPLCVVGYEGTLVNRGTLDAGTCLANVFGALLNEAAGDAAFHGRTNGTTTVSYGPLDLSGVIGTPQQHDSITIGDTGFLTLALQDLEIREGFTSRSTRASEWSTDGARLVFAGAPTHTLRWAGADLGPTAAGYVENFAWFALSLAAGEALILENADVDPTGAIYVRRLDLPGGVAQIASITGNGMNLYYDPSVAGNEYLGGQTYPLAGGGAIAPIQ